ncbi:hypothetical protein OUZ56_000928 [Daphnia magna]|uniref:Uncharacterized protein n=1 Tax=Daphnia magna TaxID=35525 RepID=A0ABR0A160_9CRUS|nr:hypothetical protein OUZ56_000928 [Daphnia magna]
MPGSTTKRMIQRAERSFNISSQQERKAFATCIALLVVIVIVVGALVLFRKEPKEAVDSSILIFLPVRQKQPHFSPPELYRVAFASFSLPKRMRTTFVSAVFRPHFEPRVDTKGSTCPAREEIDDKKSTKNL